MATHYSKRQPDSTVEYYDSKAEMEASNSGPTSWHEAIRHILGTLASSFNPILAVIGFFIGGGLCIWLVSRYQAIETWIRFVSVISGSILMGFICGKFGNIFIMVAASLFGAAVVAGGGFLVWQLLSP